MALVIGGIKMSADEYQFRASTPILYGFYTSEIGIGKVPYPTLTMLPAESFKLPDVESAKRFLNIAENYFTSIQRNMLEF
jgi:hypothetical protein